LESWFCGEVNETKGEGVEQDTKKKEERLLMTPCPVGPSEQQIWKGGGGGEITKPKKKKRNKKRSLDTKKKVGVNRSKGTAIVHAGGGGERGCNGGVKAKKKKKWPL